MTYIFHDFLIFLVTRSDNPENVDWTLSLFNHARVAPKAKLGTNDQSRERYDKLCEKSNKSMKKYQQRRTLFLL